MSKIIELLSEKIHLKKELIENWFNQKFQETPALFYNSTDLRHNNTKIAPIDTNCFPAGFNNLSIESHKEASKVSLEFFNQNFPQAKKILIIPENHTRNLRYLENIFSLHQILSTHKEVKVGTLIDDITQETAFETEKKNIITLNPIKKQKDRIVTQDGFEADIIILNNDLTDGIPEILKNITTTVIPSTLMGWHSRTKSAHFDIYNQLAQELAQILEIDPWLISSIHRSCHEVNFKEQIGLDCLANYVDQIITLLREKYKEHNIEGDPYCYIKADNGTYGIAVWPVSSGKEVMEINKKERNKMNMLKGSVQNTQVMIQEGIPTQDKIDNKIAEPMIYLINGKVVGNLFRVNEDRDEKISLNAAGATFCDLSELKEEQTNISSDKNRMAVVYSLISRLAALAAAVENRNALIRNE
ncbi:MAG: glutamate--cysteine ligase [Pelagibacterales bacterium]|nr:glutamate--cysteine ligase [Pelagibacterales bacterium]